jgi:hypothetical protein
LGDCVPIRSPFPDFKGAMRLLIVLVIGGALGWIGGSLYPAPSALLARITPTAVEQPADEAPSPDLSLSTTAEASERSAPAPPAPTSRRGAVDEQTLAQYRAWIHEARQAHTYADSEERMYAVMMCESRGQATIVSPAGHSGLFQYSRATWNGAWNTYRDQGILNPRAQIFATSLAWQRNMQRHWGGCYSNPH